MPDASILPVKMTFRQQLTNLAKAFRGVAMVSTGNELLTLSMYAEMAVAKSLMERYNSPSWRQQEDAFKSQSLSTKAYNSYSQLPWFYSSVFAIANAYASVPVKFRSKQEVEVTEGEKPETELVTVEDPWVNLLFKTPNPYQSMYDLREATSSYLEMVGTAYWEVGRKEVGTPGAGEHGSTDKGKVLALWPIRPDLAMPIGDPDKLVTHYEYYGSRVGLEDAIIPAEHVIQFRNFHPTSDHIGMGSLEPSLSAAENMLNTAAWERSWWKNSARPDLVLMMEQQLGTPQLNRYLGQFEQRHQGTDNAARVAAIHGVKDIKEIGAGYDDMDLTGIDKMNREKMFATTNVVPAVLGLVDEARFKNVLEQLRLFWSVSMGPKLAKELGVMDRTMSVEIGRELGLEGVEAWHDTSGIDALQEDKDKKHERVRKDFREGLILRSTAQGLLDYEPDTENDGYFLDVAAPFGPATIAASSKPGDVDDGDGGIVVPFVPSAEKRR